MRADEIAIAGEASCRHDNSAAGAHEHHARSTVTGRHTDDGALVVHHYAADRAGSAHLDTEPFGSGAHRLDDVRAGALGSIRTGEVQASATRCHVLRKISEVVQGQLKRAQGKGSALIECSHCFRAAVVEGFE